MTTRREFLLTAACAPLGGCALFSGAPDARLPEIRAGASELTLTAARHDIRLAGRGGATPAWLFADRPFPVLRLAHGEELNVTLRNALAEHTSIHWHGVRVPNSMDGVPYLTQRPVQPGEAFHYRFVPPDAGTYLFHPHCDTAVQMGRGLVGALIVDDGARFDDDIVMILKDWRLDAGGAFLPLYTAAGASQSGSFGTLRTVNGAPAPAIATAADAFVRMRLINADTTRIMEIGIDGADARVIAIDGNPAGDFPLESWRLGPGMRLDLGVRTASSKIRLLDYFAAQPVVLATVEPGGASGTRSTTAAAPRDFAAFQGARRVPLELGAGVEGADLPPPPAPIVLPNGETIDLADSLCLAQDTFWTLNGKAWPLRDHAQLPPPLFTFRRGEPVVFEISNTTSRAHPIHVHGHTLTILSASILKRPVHRADTVIVMPNERVSAGFVADNPGNWMIHCHVIEHQETGMMGWFRVS